MKNSAHNGAVCTKSFVEIHHVNVPTSNAQMIRARREEGVDIGSVIMKKEKSRSEPVLNW